MSSFSVFSSNAIGSCLEDCPAGSILDRFFPSDLMEDSAHYVLVLLLGSLDVTHILKNSTWLVCTTESRIMVAGLKIVDLIIYVLYVLYHF